jgi:hypothetical protein
VLKYFLKEKTEKKKAPATGGRDGVVKIFEEKFLPLKNKNNKKFSSKP